MQVVGVAWSGDEASFQGFVDEHDLTFHQVNDSSGELFAKFGVPVQPAWAFVGSEGSARLEIGAMADDTLDAMLESLVD